MNDTFAVLNAPFSIVKHKETFVNYLEVIIDEIGIVHYAVPSHQEWLIHKACMVKHISRQQLEGLCPPQYYCDYMTWLTMETGCVAVWNNFYAGKLNKRQHQTLKKLKEAKIYAGLVE